MKCPVCKINLNDDATECPVCEFADLQRVFINREEAEDWRKKVVLPHRVQFEKKYPNFIIEGNKLVKYIGSPILTGLSIWKWEIKIPSFIEVIGSGAFEYDGVDIHDIELPEGILIIEDNAFRCSTIRDISLPNSLMEIHDSAFKNCSDLWNVKLPNGLRYIGNCAFQGCSRLSHIDIPASVTHIGDSAFSGCKALTICCTNDGYAKKYADKYRIPTLIG